MVRATIPAVVLALALGAWAAQAGEISQTLKAGESFSHEFDPPVHELCLTITRVGTEGAGGKAVFHPEGAPPMPKRFNVGDKPITLDRCLRRTGFKKLEVNLYRGEARLDLSYEQPPPR